MTPNEFEAAVIELAAAAGLHYTHSSRETLARFERARAALMALQPKPKSRERSSEIARLSWAAAPRCTEWGDDMMEALVALGNDSTLRLYAEKSALPLVGPATDLSLIEAAGRAAGLHFDASHNPLSDDALALRLAVKLRLRVDCYDQQVETMDGCEPYKILRETFTNTFVCIEPTDGGQDPYAATRRAIVRAAASLGQDGAASGDGGK